MKTPETDYQRDISGSAKSISSTSRGHCARPHCEDNDCGAERERGHRVSKNAVNRTPEIEHRPKEASSEHHVKSITLERSARQSPEIDECDTKRNALARCESGVSKSAIKIPERGLSSRGTPSEQHADGIDSEDCTLRLPQTGERETTKRTLANRGRGRSVISASFPLPPPGMCSPGPANFFSVHQRIWRSSISCCTKCEWSRSRCAAAGTCRQRNVFPLSASAAGTDHIPSTVAVWSRSCGRR